jgi:hypothetical protein
LARCWLCVLIIVAERDKGASDFFALCPETYADNAGSLTVTMEFYTLAADETDLQLITLCRLLGKEVTLAEVAEAKELTIRQFRDFQFSAERQEPRSKLS